MPGPLLELLSSIEDLQGPRGLRVVCPRCGYLAAHLLDPDGVEVRDFTIRALQQFKGTP